MSIPLVKGMRDFYPEEMAVRNWLTDAWRRVSLRNGFVEFDGPVIESLDLYKAKSGEGIVSELYNFEDRGGRELALRPETTPSLARMINARVNSLPRPIKWFSISQCFRAENPQKGRTREFLQWNVDFIGSDDVLADAECVFTAVDLLAELGLTADDVVVRIGSRPLTVAALRAVGVGPERVEKVLPILDKRSKISDEAFRQLCVEAGGLNSTDIETICKFQDCETVDELRQFDFFSKPEAQAAFDEIVALFNYLTAMGVEKYIRLDLGIVRGLAYYTGVVYEIFDKAASLRAVGGGGRYDNLLEVLGGPKIGGTGFGMGDVVLGILLKEKDKLPADLLAKPECFVVVKDSGYEREALRVVGALRRQGVSCDYSTKRNVSKAMKEANRRGARFALIVEHHEKEIVAIIVKDMETGKQGDPVGINDFLAEPRKYLGA